MGNAVWKRWARLGAVAGLALIAGALLTGCMCGISRLVGGHGGGSCMTHKASTSEGHNHSGGEAEN